MKLVFLFLIFNFAMAGEIPLEEKLRPLLPAPINQFKIKSTTISQIEEQLGKAHLVEGSDYYWEKDQLKYALKLTFNKKRTLTSIHYTFAKHRPQLSKIGAIDSKKLRPSQMIPYSVLKENAGEAVIEPLTKTIYSIKLW